MDERVLQFRVGVMVVSAAIITVALVFMLAENSSPFRGKRTIYVQFPEAPGVTVNTPIRKSGVLVGRVSDVTLIDRGVIITALIDDQYKIRTSELCRISSETILGDSVVEFVPVATKGEEITFLEDGAYISGAVATDPLQAVEDLQVSFNRAADSFVQTSAEVANAAAGITTVVDDNEEQLARVMAKAETAMTQFETTMASIDGVVNDEEMQTQLKQALTEVPALVADARAAMQSISTTSANLDTTATKFSAAADEADVAFEQMGLFTKALGEKGELVFEDIDSIAEQMDLLLAELVVFSKNLNDSEGSVGQFVSNPELYQKLNRSADNIELITRRLRPVVEDVRVFSDKIARDPGRLGLKGALQRGGTGTKWLPTGNYQMPSQQPGYLMPATPPPTHLPPSFGQPAYPHQSDAPQQFWSTQ